MASGGGRAAAAAAGRGIIKNEAVVIVQKLDSFQVCILMVGCCS